MGTTADKLALLKANKESIRDAITEKIGEDAGAVMSTYAEKIRSIETKPKYYRTTILLDQTITDPATMITKVYDDGGIAMIRANSHRYVCKLVDGVLEAKQLQDDHGTLYLDGSLANLTGDDGDVFMKLPQFYYKAYKDTSGAWLIDFVYGDFQQNSGYKHWDGRDFIGVFEASSDGAQLFSWSGQKPVTISQKNMKTRASAKGNGYSLVKWKHHSMMAFLFCAYYLNTNSQDVIGASAGGYDNATGGTALLGMEDTIGKVNGNSQAINFWGLEYWWANKYEWIDNAIITSNVGDNVIITIAEDDGERTITMPSEQGYISQLSIGEYLDAAPVALDATSTTRFCDEYLTNGSVNNPFARSSYSTGANGGIFFLYSRASAGETFASITSRLAYRGEYKIIE